MYTIRVRQSAICVPVTAVEGQLSENPFLFIFIPNYMKCTVHILLMVTVVSIVSTACNAQSGSLAGGDNAEDGFMELSLEELMKVKVITATKNQQPIT